MVVEEPRAARWFVEADGVVERRIFLDQLAWRERAAGKARVRCGVLQRPESEIREHAGGAADVEQGSGGPLRERVAAGDVGIDVPPYDLAGRRDLEEVPLHALADQRVAVGLPLHAGDDRGEEARLRAAVAPDWRGLAVGRRLDLHHRRPATAVGASPAVVEDEEIPGPGQPIGDPLDVVLPLERLFASAAGVPGLRIAVAPEEIPSLARLAAGFPSGLGRGGAVVDQPHLAELPARDQDLVGLGVVGDGVEVGPVGDVGIGADAGGDEVEVHSLRILDDLLGLDVVRLAGVVRLNEVVGEVPFPHDRSPGALLQVGLDLENRLPPQLAVGRRIEFGGIASQRDRLGPRESFPGDRQDVAVGEEDRVVMELVLGVSERVRPDRLVVPIDDLDLAGRSVAAEGPLRRREDRVAEDRSAFEEIDRRRPPGAGPGANLLAVVVDEVGGGIERRVEERVALLGLWGIDEHAHGLSQREARLERFDAGERSPRPAAQRLRAEISWGVGRGHDRSLADEEKDGAAAYRRLRSGKEGNPGCLGNPAFGFAGLLCPPGAGAGKRPTSTAGAAINHP